MSHSQDLTPEQQLARSSLERLANTPNLSANSPASQPNSKAKPMPRFTIIPMFNLNDPSQTVDDVEQAKALAEEFLRKFGGPDCQEMAVVEVRLIGTVEFTRPVWHPAET